MSATDVPVDGTRPNIVLIYTDDQGYGDASALNPRSKFETPNVDRIAAEGVSFSDGHCPDTVCTPSRYGLLTGRYCWRTELKRRVIGAERECLIDPGRVTLPGLLSRHGYRTAMTGKWHLGMQFPGEKGDREWSEPVSDGPTDYGFDYFFGLPASMNFGALAWFEGRHPREPPTMWTRKTENELAIDDYRIRPPYSETRETPEDLEVAPNFVDREALTWITDSALESFDRFVRNEDSTRAVSLASSIVTGSGLFSLG